MEKISVTETNPMRNYYLGDAFYVPEETARVINAEKTDENDMGLIPGGIVIVLKQPSEVTDFSTAVVKFIAPDGTEMKATMSRKVLNALPPDRRYGRALTAIDMKRPWEICGIVPKGTENEPTRFRNSDSDAKINELRVEAGRAVWQV